MPRPALPSGQPLRSERGAVEKGDGASVGEGNPRPRRQPTSPSDGGWKLGVGLA